MKDIIRKVLKEEREYKKYSRNPEYKAKKRAQKDIKKHFYKVDDPWAHEGGKPSEEWPKYSLPYDTEFFFDDISESEELEDDDDDLPTFDEVYDKLWDKMLYSVCMKYTNDLDKAQDFCQAGFLRVMNNFEKYRSSGSLEGWIRRIIQNNTIDMLRKEKNKKKVNTDVDWERVEVTSSDKPYSEDYFFDDKRYTKEDLHRGLSMLSPKYREVITKYFIEGLTHEEIAEEMGVNIGTSKSNLHKAKKNLLDIIRK